MERGPVNRQERKEHKEPADVQALRSVFALFALFAFFAVTLVSRSYVFLPNRLFAVFHYAVIRHNPLVTR